MAADNATNNTINNTTSSAYPHTNTPISVGELRCGGARLTVHGRTLQLMLWLATHQRRINTVASDSGQLWLTWKGEGGDSISGDVKTTL